jgi:hypothetical protein
MSVHVIPYDNDQIDDAIGSAKDIAINVKTQGLLGNDTNNDAVQLNALISSIGSTKTDIYFPSGIYKIGSNVVFPSNVRLIMAYGAILKRTNSAIITLNCEISAGLYQIFDDDGTGSWGGSPKIKEVYPEWFGAVGDGIINDYTSITKTIATSKVINKNIYLSNYYKITGEQILLFDEFNNLSVIGNGNSGFIFDYIFTPDLGDGSEGYEHGSWLEVRSDDITFDNITVKTNYTLTDALYYRTVGIMVVVGKNIDIKNCKIRNVKYGIWLNPYTKETIENVSIDGNDITKINVGVHLGYYDSTDIVGRTDVVKHITISNNKIYDGLGEMLYTSNYNGIKISENTQDVIINGNKINNMKADGIDGYTSGDTLIISCNELSGNTQCGIEIKRDDFTYPPATFGYNRRCIISNNIIDSNGDDGIAILRIVDDEGLANGVYESVIVKGNIITRNASRPISCNANYAKITNNIIENNNELVIFSGLSVATPQIGCSFNDNVVRNNGIVGATGATIYQLYAGDYCDIEVSGNTFDNSTTIPNGSTLAHIGYGSYGKIHIGKNFFYGTYTSCIRNREVLTCSTFDKVVVDLSSASFPTKTIIQKLYIDKQVSIVGAYFISQANIPAYTNGSEVVGFYVEVKREGSYLSNKLYENQGNTTGYVAGTKFQLFYSNSPYINLESGDEIDVSIITNSLGGLDFSNSAIVLYFA